MDNMSKFCQHPRTPFPETSVPVADPRSKSFDAPSPGQIFFISMQFSAIFDRIIRWELGLVHPLRNPGSAPEYHAPSLFWFAANRILFFDCLGKYSSSLIPERKNRMLACTSIQCQRKWLSRKTSVQLPSVLEAPTPRDQLHMDHDWRRQVDQCVPYSLNINHVIRPTLSSP